MPLFPKLPFPERPAGPDEVVLDVRDVQALSLDLLDAFDAFCKAHGLRYYLCCGTLLGAVRHGGFIPWDDDIDLFMSRPDYERLVKLGETESFGPDIEFACLQNGKFPRPFARLYNLRTQVQRKMTIPISGDHVWIDILPVDGLPDDPKAIRRAYKWRYPIYHYNFCALWKVGAGNRKLTVLRHWRHYWFVGPIGPWRLGRLLDWLGRRRRYENCDTVGCYTAARYGAGEAMPKSEYEIPARITFEGREFETMSCWEKYLSGIYGDYMQLPPVEKREAHLEYVTMSRADHQALRLRYPNLTEK